MRLTVLLFAALRERAGTAELVLEDLPEALDVAGLKRELCERLPQLGSLDHVRGVLESTYVSETAKLTDGATLALIPPVSGGRPEPGECVPEQPEPDYARGVFELCLQAIDPLDCQRRVEHASCGAAVLFTGMTRDRNRGLDVVRLEYEAYAEMSAPEMSRIFARCREELGADDAERGLRMLCQHRIGTVEIGQPSVVIAVASPHRDLAFRAARFLIDELKASLPVWKKELYPGGEHWIGDRS